MNGTAPEVETTWIIIKRRFRRTIGFVSWVFPFVIMFLCWLLFSPLSDTVSWPWKARPDVWAGLFVELFLTAAWVVAEMYYAANRETSVSQLQVDSIVSSGFALFFTFFGAIMVVTQILPWFYVLPWLGTVIDCIGSGFFAINNAAQKPIVQNVPAKP